MLTVAICIMFEIKSFKNACVSREKSGRFEAEIFRGTRTKYKCRKLYYSLIIVYGSIESISREKSHETKYLSCTCTIYEIHEIVVVVVVVIVFSSVNATRISTVFPTRPTRPCFLSQNHSGSNFAFRHLSCHIISTDFHSHIEMKIYDIQLI